VLWFGLALLLFGLFTFVAHRQAPRPDPFQPVQPLTTLDWWKYPIERNAFKRLPVINSDLNDVFALPNSRKVWAVGDNGVIVHSDDGGETWVQQEVNWDVVADSLLTENLPEQEQQQVDGKEVFDASQQLQNVFRSNVAQKGLNPAPKQANAPVRTPITKPTIMPQMPPSLSSVHFVDANHGWAVGSSGTILVTSNGGTTWQPQRSGTTNPLSFIHFVNATTGWAVGGGGTILATSNGGATWQPQTSETTTPLYSVHFVNTTTGWAVGDWGTILVTTNGGATWQPQTGGTTSTLFSVHFVNATAGWAVGDYGTILVTSNGGATWQSQMSGTINPLFFVHFVNTTAGWAVGDLGTILVTTNGGATWQAQTSGTRSPLNSVYFMNATTGWAVGWNATILRTDNGGSTWQTQASGTMSSLYSVHFVDATTGWAVGSDLLRGRTILLHTRNGGVTWQVQENGTRGSLYSVHFVNATTGWAVGDLGTIFVTTNGGATWLPQRSGTTNLLSSVHFVNATTGWAVGYEGTILATSNGGATWQAQTTGGTKSNLYSVHFVDAMKGWIVGRHGTILKTTDGGQTWNPIKYSRSFAPWYYLTWLFLAPLLYLAFKRPKPIEAEQKTVADMLVSDRPISAGDPDPLEFNSIARGLSRFLRNENTQPPLTIAITGEWGSGKSSLMNLLKADLERYGFRPVWFNAWHHQKEEHLLAALLQNIRKQALPHWWRPEGVSFRARLFWRRIKRYRLLALLLLAGFAMAAGYFATEPSRLENAVHQLESIFTDKETEKGVLNWLQSKLKTLGSGSVLTLLSSVGAALLLLWRSLRAFGVNPANLMASLSSSFKLSEVKAQMGFRHDFAREFSEVTAALNPRTMLILIDDLDRCRPENVLEVLEAVNFLVSSGDCFVVLGLDLHRVERCVGLGFRDVAEELVDDPTNEANNDGGKTRRAEFARQYLEKLINIEVPVPQPRSEQSEHLIVPPEPVAPAPLLWWQNLLQLATPLVRKVSPWLLAAAVVVAGFWLGAKQFSPQSEAPNNTTPPPKAAPSDTTSRLAPSTSSTQPTRRDTPADSSRGTGELIQPQKEPTSFTFVYVALAMMIGLGIWRLSIPTDLVVKDSPEFIDALKIWHPLLIAKRNTPRSVKRFVNRVRYFAMRQSAETEGRSIWQRLLIWAGLRHEEKVKEDKAIPESSLVALSAIHHFEPQWVDPVCQWKGSIDGLRITKPLSSDQNFLGTPELEESLKAHIRKFGTWPPSEEDRERLEKLSAGIRIN
jgi:photosystem II stability/assembly factor-like uncharacterized protein